MKMTRPTDAWRQHAFMLAIFAFVLRALIPVGFMPDQSSPLRMVICAGIEGQKTVASGDYDPAHQPGDGTQKSSCAYVTAPGGMPAAHIWASLVALPSVAHAHAQAANITLPFHAPYISRAPPSV